VKVTPGGLLEHIEATEAERAALAGRLRLFGVDRLVATVKLRRVRGEMVRVEGTLEADVVQNCVVSLEPVPAHVTEEFSALFAPDHLLPKDEGDVDAVFSLEDLDDDVPEPMPGGRIDIGELTTQHLSLALDPYPRKEGAVFEAVVEHEDDVVPEKPNPFAGLARLKRSP
jgi:uncharacterized metal-binding protein YceD (DUF177 family)